MCISRIFGGVKTYYVYNQKNNAVEGVQLNRVHQLLRRIFGAYSDTHLYKASSKALAATLLHGFQPKEATYSAFNQLLTAHNRRYKDHFISLPSYNTKNGTIVHVAFRYHNMAVKELQSCTSIDFKVTLVRNKVPTEAILKIFRDKDSNLQIDTYLDIQINGRSNPQHGAERLDTSIYVEEATAVNSLLNVIMSSSPHQTQIAFLPHTYMQQKGTYRQEDVRRDNHRFEVMKRYGWSGWGIFNTDNRFDMYTLERNNVVITNERQPTYAVNIDYATERLRKQPGYLLN
ncbi:MAG: hypothetical protein H0X51_01980 [Parachlamydiaceae bacterium]|nr:hypothetical protein [Parachlamydiaceae bacterium]